MLYTYNVYSKCQQVYMCDDGGGDSYIRGWLAYLWGDLEIIVISQFCWFW